MSGGAQGVSMLGGYSRQFSMDQPGLRIKPDTPKGVCSLSACRGNIWAPFFISESLHILAPCFPDSNSPWGSFANSTSFENSFWLLATSIVSKCLRASVYKSLLKFEQGHTHRTHCSVLKNQDSICIWFYPTCLDFLWVCKDDPTLPCSFGPLKGHHSRWFLSNSHSFSDPFLVLFLMEKTQWNLNAASFLQSSIFVHNLLQTYVMSLLS